MNQLIVRNLPTEIIQRLRKQAASHSRSVEAEHREILKDVLLPKRTQSLENMLLAMPDVGDDSDFERPKRLSRKVIV